MPPEPSSMATMTLDSPGGVYPESPNDQEDVVYPCKGCGEILEEGKAFELAGNRWHIDCFRCNTCGTLLDSDANLLLLGDGSLICNNCTYSCNACGNKIEDLAILTGEQAFCASCFRCRNCKKKIENLRYARTSQGIFCMSCHESLMARRRRKGKTASRQAPGATSAAATVVEKALPSLPPGAVPSTAFSPDLETPPSESYSGTPRPRSPKEQQHPAARREAQPRSRQRDESPLSDEARRDGPTLPASTYGDSRPSNVSEDTDDGDERGFLPMAFDPTPALGPPPSIARKQVARPMSSSSPVAANENRPPRDYFSGRGLSGTTAQRDGLRDDQQPPSPWSGSTEQEAQRAVTQPKTSPHILFQEKGRNVRRDASGGSTPLTMSTGASPSTASNQDKPERPQPRQLDTSSFTVSHNEAFKLQEVPKMRRAGSRSSSSAEQKSPLVRSPVETSVREQKVEKTASPVSLGSQHSGVNPFDDPRRNESSTSGAAPPPSKHADRPTRADSLAAATAKGKPATPDPPTLKTVKHQSVAQSNPTPAATRHKRDGSVSSIPSSFVDAHSTLSRDNSALKTDSTPPPTRPSFDAPPPRASSRPVAPPAAGGPSAPSKSVANGDFIAPRAPPPPPPIEGKHKKNESISTMQSFDARSDDQLFPPLRSAGLPKHGADSPFSMEDEMTRILRADERQKQSIEGAPPSMLRKVSNAVKHARSFSDRGLHSAGRSPPNGAMEISSPMTIGSPSISSPTARDGIEQMRAHLRRANHRIAELEAELKTLEERVNSSAEIKAAETELNRKRDTMIVLDTQREMVVAELESMTAHLKRVKESNQPLDLTKLKSEILQDFADSLQKLKDQMSSQIEDLMHTRNELTDEIGTLIQMKDKGFQEYESLSSRNAQLLEMNNQLVHNIQETYKANRAPNGAFVGPANGLGIYPSSAKQDTPGPSEMRSLNLLNTDPFMPSLLQETEAEPATVLTGPQVVNIRKGQPKKFNWRKGGEKMAKNISKGVKGAFVGDRPPNKDGSYDNISLPYTQPQTMEGASEQSSVNSGGVRVGVDGNRGAAGFGGLFGPKNGGLKAGGLSNMRDSSSTNLAVAADASVLFGSELEARCEYEKRVIPAVVVRCVEEVEARGMDVEGIYRKSGGAGQVKTVQQGFEKDGNYDISDPDLDIHAVTSALKQYFRKLPVPLIPYKVYDSLLDAGQIADREKQASYLRMAMNDLPEHHRNCLEYLVQHLVRVMSHEADNLMTPLNLAVVFAPTIMRPQSIEREMTDMLPQRMAVQALLDQHHTLFVTDE